MPRIDKGARSLIRLRRQGQRTAVGEGIGFGNGLFFDTDSGTVSLLLDLDPALDFGPDGELSVLLRSDGGLDKDTDGLGILIPASAGLVATVAGLAIDLRDTNPGLELAGSGLGVLLNATDPALSLTGGLAVLLDGTSLTRAAGGLSVTAPEGRWTVTAIQTGAFNAAAGQLVRCDPSGGTFDVTLPTAVGIAGRQILVKNTTSDTTAIGVLPSGAETIDGGPGLSITNAFGFVRVVSDGANWMQT